MPFEWRLDTPVIRAFKAMSKITSAKEVIGVDDDGEPSTIIVEEVTEHEVEIESPADRVRVLALGNDTRALQFHIRLLYGRLAANGEVECAARDDGIIIGGPEYADLDTNEDGLISEDELLNMSAKILGWDGELREINPLPVEGPAS
jgi:hypothetical protein